MHTFRQNQTAAETIAPSVGATVSPAIAAIAHDEKTIAVLLEAAEKAEQKRRIMQRVADVLPIVFCATSVSWVASICFGRSPWLDLAIVVTSIWVHLFNFVFRNDRSPTKQLHKAVSCLLQFPDDPRFLLPLIDALTITQTPEEKSKSLPLLTEHLWNLHATDVTMLLDDTRCFILRKSLSNICCRRSAIKREANVSKHLSDLTTDLAVAIMKTLAGLGDKKSVKVLEKVIKSDAKTPNETVVRDAAREYLPALLQKIAENEAVQQELRRRATEHIRSPYTVLEEYMDAFSSAEAKAALAEFLRVQPQSSSPISAAIFGGATFAAFVFMRLFSESKPDIELLGFIFVIGNVLLSVARSQTSSPEARRVAYELAKRSENDPRLLPVLLLAAQTNLDKKQAEIVKKALARLLPLLQPGDASLVPPAQRATLRSWLKLPRNRKKAGSGSQTLTIVALDALAAIGDTKALPAAAQIARQTRSGSYREAELHEAAIRCVAALEGRNGTT